MPFRRFVPPLVLTAVTLLLWCAVTGRWSVPAWQTPLQFHGDPLEIYTRVQAAAEDLSQPLRGYDQVPRLAAPFGADWTRYPVSDRVVFTGLGWLARGVGVFAAVNLAMAAVHVLNALSFFLCARFLRWRREWALATALLFSFSSYNFRWGVTVSFSLSFVLPPLLLLCGWIARAAPPVAARGWTWLALALGAWLGGANPYLVFFGCQLVAWSVVLQFARRGERARWRAGAVFLSTAVLSFLLHNAAYFLATTEASPRLTLARNYAGSEIYALKLIDLLVPPAEHPLFALGDLGRAYQAQSALRTEFFVNYLGLAGLAGLLVLLWTGGRALLRRNAGRVPDAFLGLLWTLAFSAVGGVNSLLAFAGLDIFRASNRNSVFILVWALFFLGRWGQRWWRPRWPVVRYALPLLIAGLGILDALPQLKARRLLAINAAQIETQRGLMHALEQRVGPHGLVFQLPATVFPEAGLVVKMPDYEHLSAYLLSDTLRFSYGALRGTAVSRCLRALGRLPALMLREELEAAGFHALWLNRRGLPDRGEPLIRELRELGLEPFPQNVLPDIVIFLLEPSSHPRPLNVNDTRLYEPWDVISSLKHPELVVFDGWYDLEREENRSWRWARDAATAGIRMPAPGVVQLSFRAYSLSPGQLVITCDGREIYRQPVSPATRDPRAIVLPLGVGRHPLEWRFTGRLMHPSSADGRQLGFAIENLELELLAPPAPL